MDVPKSIWEHAPKIRRSIIVNCIYVDQKSFFADALLFVSCHTNISRIYNLNYFKKFPLANFGPKLNWMI